jgi:Methylamine utilisation protein MauE
VSAALTPAFVVAALLLCVAGAFKLREPGPAAGALRTLGLPAGAWIVRILAAGEILLGALCAAHPTRVIAAVLTGTYLMFAGVAAALSMRRAACGCFGEDETPVSAVHWIASATLAVVSAAAAVAGSHGLGWVLGQPAPGAAVLVVGIAGALYATVLLYTQLPAAWTVWSGE